MNTLSTKIQLTGKQWLNDQLTQLEQQFAAGNLPLIDEVTRDRIENALRDLYDIDDVNLLYGTPEGSPYMRLRESIATAVSDPSDCAA